MTKKHYEAIAGILSDFKPLGELTELHVDTIAEDLADYFATENPKFDRARFLTACGLKPILDDVKCKECGSDVHEYYRSCTNPACDWTQ